MTPRPHSKSGFPVSVESSRSWECWGGAWALRCRHQCCWPGQRPGYGRVMGGSHLGGRFVSMVADINKGAAESSSPLTGSPG